MQQNSVNGSQVHESDIIILYNQNWIDQQVKIIQVGQAVDRISCGSYLKLKLVKLKE